MNIKSTSQFVLVIVVAVGVMGCGEKRELAYDFSERDGMAQPVVVRNSIDVGDSAQGVRLGDGWGDAERLGQDGTTFAWALGEAASVDFELIRGEYDRLEFRCWPAANPEDVQQIVDVSVNGTELGSVALQRRVDTYSVPVDRGVLRMGTNVVTFNFAYASVPAQHISGASDNRALAVAFDWVRFKGAGEETSVLSRAQTEQVARKKGVEGGPGEAGTQRGGERTTPGVVDGDLVTPPGSGLIYSVAVPEGASLDLGVEASPGVVGEVWVRRGNNPWTVLLSASSRTLDEEKHHVPMAQYAGQVVDLGFTCWPETAVEEEQSGVRWVEPTLWAVKSGKERDTNIVLIVVDTLRADFVGCYGGDVETPNIDALAAQGVRFENAYCSIPITLPSHSSLFTSTIPAFHGAHNNGDVLDPEFLTLAEMMSASNRRTGGVVSLGVLKSKFGIAQGFEEYGDEFGPTWYKTAEEVNEEVLSWLDSHGSKPFFLWVHYSDPHEPYAAPTRDYVDLRIIQDGEVVKVVEANGHTASIPVVLPPGSTRLRLERADGSSERPIACRGWRIVDASNCDISLVSGWDGGPQTNPQGSTRSVLPAVVDLNNSTGETVEGILRFLVLEETSIPEIRQRYIEEVEYVDDHIGKLLERLKSQGASENTMIVFTGDHGEGLGDHGHVGHISQLYDSLVRVPLIFTHPGRLPAGVAVDAPVGLIDVVPTITDFLSLTPPDNVQGRSLLPVLSESGADSVPIVLETYRPQAPLDKKGLVMNGLKYIATDGENGREEELFDLASDPGELRDLAADRPDDVASMREVLQRLLTEATSQGMGPASGAGLSEEERARLRALGYVN